MDNRCQFYNKHLDTIREYESCLYSLEGCECGGFLHILLDDNNIDDDDITFCMKECLNHPEREESQIGILICQEYLKLSMEQRRLLFHPELYDGKCFYGECCKCPIVTDDE